MEESGTKLHISLVLKHFVLFPQKLSECGRVFLSLYKPTERNAQNSLAMMNYAYDTSLQETMILTEAFHTDRVICDNGSLYKFIWSRKAN